MNTLMRRLPVSRGPLRLTGRRRALTVTIAVAGAAAAACGLLSGCGTASAVEASGLSPDTTIELIAGSQASSFSLTLECGAAQEARRLGINLTVAAPASPTPAEQKALVDGVLVGNPDALIIEPTSTTVLNQSLVVAQENDTKIIFIGATPTDRYLGASLVMADEAAGGALAADGLGRLTGGHGTVAVLTAPDGGTVADARIAGFRKELAARYPGVTVLPVQVDAADSGSAARRTVAADLRAHPALAGVLALTDATVLGTEAALRQANKTGTVKVATFEAGPLQMTGLDTGAIELAVAEEPAVEGAQAVDQAVNAVAERPVTPQVTTPMVAITRQNMNAAAVKPYIYDGICSSSLRGYMTAGD